MGHARRQVFDAQHGDAHAAALRQLHAHGQVAVARHQHGVADRMVRGQLDQVAHDQRVHALLVAAPVDGAGAELHVVHLHDGLLLRREAMGHHAVVPGDGQQLLVGQVQCGARLGQQEIHEGGRVRNVQVGARAAAALAQHFDRLPQQVAGIDHHDITIHSTGSGNGKPPEEGAVGGAGR